MLRHALIAAALFAPLPAIAQEADSGTSFTVAPIPTADTRSKFVPPVGGVYVINQKSGEIVACYTDIKDTKYIVICTPPAKLSP